MERNISVDDIKSAIREPESSHLLPDGITKCVKRVEKGVLVVVYSRKRGEYVIITAYIK